MAKAKSHIVIDTKDYLIIEEGDKPKKYLVQVTGFEGDKVNVVFDGISRAYAETTQTATIDPKQIVSNLGRKPYNGTAYGVKIEPYIKTETHAFFGDIHFFHRLDDHYEDALFAALDRVAASLKKMGLSGEFPIETEIRPPKGKYAGSYRFRPAKKHDLLSLHPKEWGNRKAVELLIWHEVGHHIHTRYWPRSLERLWITAYHNNVSLSRTTSDDLKELRTDFIKSGDLVHEFGKELDEERGLIWDAIIDWIAAYHALKPKHLDILIDGGNNLKDIWPTDPVFLSDQDVLITEYANKDPYEFWCESFCYYMMGGLLPGGDPMPERIVELVEQTLDAINKKASGRQPTMRLKVDVKTEPRLAA